MGFGEQICSGIGAQVLLDLGSEGIVLDFVDQKVRAWDGQEACRYIFRTDRRLVELLVREHEVDWVNSLFLSMRFSAARKGPYNDYLYTWFKCLDLERIQYAEGFYAEKAKSDGLLRHRRLGGPAALPAHEGRPQPVRLDRGRRPDLLAPWPAVRLETGRCLTSEGHEITARSLTEDESWPSPLRRRPAGPCWPPRTEGNLSPGADRGSCRRGRGTRRRGPVPSGRCDRWS